MVKDNLDIGVSQSIATIVRYLLIIDVRFEAYGDSSLNFILQVWTSAYTDRPNILKSELYYEIFAKFKENNVEIPFPQRDIHLKSGFEKVMDKIEIDS